MPGQELHAQCCAERQRVAGAVTFDQAVGQEEQQRQPGRRLDHAGKERVTEKKSAAGVGQRRYDTAQLSQTQFPRPQPGEQARQPHV
jgi:hypothetical protein